MGARQHQGDVFLLEDVVPGRLEIGGERRVGLGGVRELVQQQGHLPVPDHLRDGFEEVRPGVEPGNPRAARMRPPPDGARQPEPYLDRSVPGGDPVNERALRLLGPVQEQRRLADPPTPVHEDEPGAALGEHRVERRELAGSAHERLHCCLVSRRFHYLSCLA